MAAAEMAAAAETSETSVATRAAVQTSAAETAVAETSVAGRAAVETAVAGRAVVEASPDISAGDFPYRTYPNHCPYPLE